MLIVTKPKKSDLCHFQATSHDMMGSIFPEGVAMKHVIFALLFLTLMPVAAHAFIVPDTVDIRALPAGTQSGPIDLFVNSGADSLVIDSISVSSAHIPDVAAELVFMVVHGTSPDLTRLKMFQIFFQSSGETTVSVISSFPGTSRMVVPAGALVKLDDVGFDFCFACPTAKHSAVAAPGDTLRARITFHSGATKDSVLFLGIQKGSTTIAPPPGERQTPKAFETFDLSGRKITAPRTLPGILTIPKR